MSNFKHLTLTERCIIERNLTLGYSFKEIARTLNRNPSTISREVKNHRIFILSPKTNCANSYACKQRKICGSDTCMLPCKNCTLINCHEVCKSFTPPKCERLDSVPYVCNRCSNQDFCNREHAFYHAHKSHAKYLKELSESRSGVRIDNEEITRLDNLISPLMKKGQSLGHIYASHESEIGLSRKTIYNYIDKSIFEVRNINLPRKVRYKRRKSKRTSSVNYHYRQGRTYEDFTSFLNEHPDIGIVEMDTVKGKREKGKCLLTMIFTKFDFILIFLLDSASQECVKSVFNFLTDSLGIDIFRKMFPVILTDNGSEFKNPSSLEFSEYGAERTKIFYCDPMASWQKPHIERSHEFIRQVIPKSMSLDGFSQADITLLTNHINSIARDSLDGKCPFETAKSFLGHKAPRLLGLKQIPSDDVCLKPSLLK